MSYYEAQSWQLPARQTSWDQPTPPSRSGTGSAMQHEDAAAFDTQIEEVDRAVDNLNKSGKLFTPQVSRRDSLPVMGGPRPYSDFDPRIGSMGQRHSISDYEQLRPQSGSNLQSFYANQRHQPRPNEAEQMLQAKRRMAAQRERELRNYHQEQQYNRNVSTQGKSDRAISPNTMNEEDRRELIARQHRALYGNESSPYYESGNFGDESHTPRPSNPTSGNTSAGGRGPSPRGYDTYQMGHSQAQSAMAEAGGQLNANDSTQKGPSPNPQQQRSRADSTASPASNPPSQNFSLFESAAQQSSRTSTSSPGGSPPRQAKTSAPGVAPIGTRPTQSQTSNPAVAAKAPSPSPLGYGFSSNDGLNANTNSNERSTSSNSNPNPSSGNKDSNMGAWGSSGGVWGNKSSLQASVWG
ncbi:hypothetical protein N7G274_003477 [Stereocaulon virgatum]|uniref:Uncharacterized protein n=1 Tax=Stereocaulon virgatum TaxID=373712 RepID=A0ABR4ADQ9_9LECA